MIQFSLKSQRRGNYNSNRDRGLDQASQDAWDLLATVITRLVLHKRHMCAKVTIGVRRTVVVAILSPCSEKVSC